jgi:hypothetical protein
LLAPGASCTTTVYFVNVNVFSTAPRGFNRAGTIQFTDTGAASGPAGTPVGTQIGTLTGYATP